MKKRAAMILCAAMLVFAVSACSSSEETTEEPEESNVKVEDVTIEDEGSDKDSDKGSDTDSDTGSDSGVMEPSNTAPNSVEMTIEGEITYCDGAEMDVKSDDGEEYKFQISTADVTGDGGLEEGTKVTVTADGRENDNGLCEAYKVEQH